MDKQMNRLMNEQMEAMLSKIKYNTLHVHSKPQFTKHFKAFYFIRL